MKVTEGFGMAVRGVWWVALLAAAGWAGLAQAAASEEAGKAKWRAECGSCHVAYPPYLLAAEDWQQMMGELGRHFGTDAELAASDRKAITTYLQRHASEGKRFSAPSLRITETPWFKRGHRNVAPKEWTLPQVKSRANCGACHVDIGRNIRLEREGLLSELPYSAGK